MKMRVYATVFLLVALCALIIIAPVYSAPTIDNPGRSLAINKKFFGTSPALPKDIKTPPRETPRQMTNKGSFACQDTDRGIQETLKGKVALLRKGNTIESHTDYCIGKAYVKEWYCRGGDKGFKRLPCSSGCRNGACVS